jgi:DNA polymerase-1
MTPHLPGVSYSSMNKLYLIDAVGFLFRSYYAIRGMTNSKGEATNALYGFIRCLEKFRRDFEPTHLMAVFDGPNNKASRTAIHADYKSHREGMPDDLVPQLAHAMHYCELAGIPLLAIPGVEADDVIGSITKWATSKQAHVYICTSDKDLCQLVTPEVTLIQTHKDNLLIGPSEVKEIYGVHPNQITDYLGIVGDASDNIPGVPGFGPKTTTPLLEKYGTLENLLASLDELPPSKKTETLKTHQADAILSKQLATLDYLIPFDKDEKTFLAPPRDEAALFKFYQEMNFSSLLKELRLPESKSVQHLIEHPSQLEPLKSAHEICLHTSKAGISLSVKENEIYLVPLSMIPDLKPLLISKKLIGHDLKGDLHVLGFHPPHLSFDTMIASHLLDLTTSCPGEADAILSLKNQLAPQIAPLASLFEKIEMPLIPVLFTMENKGVYLDAPLLTSMSTFLKEQVEAVSKEIYEMAGEKFNIHSPKQLAVILFEKMEIPSKKKNTAADVLAEIDHPIAKAILRYRTLEKLISTYVDTLPTQINPATDRIHCTFNQCITATGRLSCQNPNLQNIPVRTAEGKKIREAFKPQKPGWVFLSADYSQIELRLLAHFSEDPTLIKAFTNKEDIHAACAATIFDIPLKEVTPELRFRAKAVNFGIIYGQGSYGLSQELGIDVAEAKQFIKKYFERYPKIEAYVEKAKQVAREKGFATTLFGRRRSLPDINSSNAFTRAQAERYAVNTPLQGSQADLIKLAMIKIDQKLKNGFMILQIHDELIFEIPQSEILNTESLVVDIMENIYPFKVPLTVNVSIGKNWGEC